MGVDLLSLALTRRERLMSMRGVAEKRGANVAFLIRSTYQAAAAHTAHLPESTEPLADVAMLLRQQQRPSRFASKTLDTGHAGLRYRL